jgi:uncharacterized protein (TIGR02284 family)
MPILPKYCHTESCINRIMGGIMVTTVGLEANFTEMVSDLIELDFDAAEAYEEAIKRFNNDNYKHVFQQFKADHYRHTEELSNFLKDMGEEPPTGPSAKRMLTKGKVILADMFGDAAILRAMKTNEDDTNTAYERAVNYANLPAGAINILERGLADERRHRDWIVQTIEQMEQEKSR